MINLNDYFNPVSIEEPGFRHLNGNAVFPHNIVIHTENNPIRDPNKYRIAIFGVPEGRNSLNSGPSRAPDAIRSQLYNLARIPGRSKIIDLGDMRQGSSFRDTLAGLSDVLQFLIGEDVFPVIIGGSSALIPAIDRAFSRLKAKYTLASVDSRIGYSNDKREPDSFNYLNTILATHSSCLNHFINIGYQTYLNDQQVINRFLKRKAELRRIGDVRQAIHLTEPLLRDSHAAIFSMNAIRQSDAPGTISTSPNGFYGEEICLLARYAGISDKLRLFGLFDVNPDNDARAQTSALAAQVVWFFLEGFSQKQFETPALSNDNSGRFVRYHVRISDMADDLIFVKSTMTDRWWMEIRGEADTKIYFACSHEDYLMANRNEVPDRWVTTSFRVKSLIP